MTGPHVEFLDDQPDGPAAAAPRTYESSSPAALDWLAVGAWTVAAALGVAASLSNVFTYRLDFSAVHSRGGYNALGRSLDPSLRNDRGTNYAVILAVGIVAFAALALAVFRDARAGGGTRLGRYAPAAAIGAVALLCGVLASIALGLVSSFASYRSLADTLDQQQANAVQLWIGPCLWFGIAALVAGVLGAVFTIRRTPHPAALPERTAASCGSAPPCVTPQHPPPKSGEADLWPDAGGTGGA
jgi:hypothetical protein